MPAPGSSGTFKKDAIAWYSFYGREPCFRAPMDDVRRYLVTRMERFGPSRPQLKALFSPFAGLQPGPRYLARGGSALEQPL